MHECNNGSPLLAAAPVFSPPVNMRSTPAKNAGLRGKWTISSDVSAPRLASTGRPRKIRRCHCAIFPEARAVQKYAAPHPTPVRFPHVRSRMHESPRYRGQCGRQDRWRSPRARSLVRRLTTTAAGQERGEFNVLLGLAIEDIGADEAEALKSVGIRTTEKLLEAAKSPKGRKLLATQTGTEREAPAALGQHRRQAAHQGHGPGICRAAARSASIR